MYLTNCEVNAAYCHRLRSVPRCAGYNGGARTLWLQFPTLSVGVEPTEVKNTNYSAACVQELCWVQYLESSVCPLVTYLAKVSIHLLTVSNSGNLTIVSCVIRLYSGIPLNDHPW